MVQYEINTIHSFRKRLFKTENMVVIHMFTQMLRVPDTGQGSLYIYWR